MTGNNLNTHEDNRCLARRDFLTRKGYGSDELTALPSDASPRRYYRLEGTGLLLLEEVPGSPDFEAFVWLSSHLCRLGFSAPEIKAVDAETGLALIEDFGQLTFTRALDAGDDPYDLYKRAIDLLISLHRHPGATSVDLAFFDADILLEELRVFTDWFVPEISRRDKARVDFNDFRDQFLSLWGEPLSLHNKGNTTLTLRDFHVDNLMLLDGREGVRACGILDFQDALIGAPAYDLVSMLQDARRDLPNGLEDDMLSLYLDAFPEIDHHDFMDGYWRLAAQRHLRIAGVFIRLAKRDGKPGYLQHMPRVLAQARKALGMAGLSEIETLIEENLNTWWRWPRS
ncbi:MAG: aminoglycoside phosphotransferase [Alphaproteobacteria bacterium]|nr:aminoglycoside phosphotransferase [Alphaproteobacteria bacterium]